MAQMRADQSRGTSEMAKVLLRRVSETEANLVAVIPDENEFGDMETLPKYWRLQITDLDAQSILTLLQSLNERVNYYDGTTFIATLYLSLAGQYHVWYVDLVDAPASYGQTLEAGGTLAVTSADARQAKIVRSRNDGRVVTPADFNTPDHTPHRTRDDDVRNIPGSPIPPELGGDQETWDGFLAQVQAGAYGPTEL